MDDAHDDLERAARAARDNAYAPYSGFRVGAALLSDDGRVFVGANVENASYGLGVCAERVAIASAVAGGARTFSRLVIVSDGEPASAPCGACRQVLHEFGPDITVTSIGPSGSRAWEASQLLPSPFGPHDLDGD